MKHISKLAATLVAALAMIIVAGCTGITDPQPAASAGSKSSSAPASHKTSASKSQHKKKTAPSETTGQREAIQAAQQYLQTQGFSKKGLIKQLSSTYGDGFSKADAKYAVNHITVDWNAQAVRVAKNYLQTQPMSESGLVKQLESPYADQFTHAQAVHGAKVAYASR